MIQTWLPQARQLWIAVIYKEEENNASNLSEATACQQHCPQLNVPLTKEGSHSQRRLCSAALMLMPGEMHLVGKFSVDISQDPSDLPDLVSNNGSF